MNRFFAYSLYEFLMVIALSAILLTLTIPIFNSLFQAQMARLTFNQIEQTIQLARSLAIANQSRVRVCASSNGYSCNQQWRGILVLVANTGFTQYFDLSLSTKVVVLLAQSGRQTNMVEIQANGLASSNGHFIYKSLKTSNQSQFNLYFNKALKMYMA